ncbi:hypothetical protein J1605_005512 [Eschrichtius robustus]|uniref:Uncharacterized protein n=1 Tax=Eschrichtius robustus TaxID=9764 RepID=A0AB34H8G6_ESCRO|nr:hypothetical protein J1605_005512 [Eschrichtius robustus]
MGNLFIQRCSFLPFFGSSPGLLFSSPVPFMSSPLLPCAPPSGARPCAERLTFVISSSCERGAQVQFCSDYDMENAPSVLQAGRDDVIGLVPRVQREKDVHSGTLNNFLRTP